MLLRNGTEMRKDMDKSLLTLQQKYTALAILDISLNAGVGVIALSFISLFFLEDNGPVIGVVLLIVGSLICLWARKRRNTKKNQHKEIVQYLEFLLSDPRNREYYSSIPEEKKTGTGFKPKPGTRMKKHCCN